MTSTTTDVSTLLMIDSATARDRDDAFTVIPLTSGRGCVRPYVSSTMPAPTHF